MSRLPSPHPLNPSPHIDTRNIGPFCSFALGDYKEGTGALCVESGPREVTAINTKVGGVNGLPLSCMCTMKAKLLGAVNCHYEYFIGEYCFVFFWFLWLKQRRPRLISLQGSAWQGRWSLPTLGCPVRRQPLLARFLCHRRGRGAARWVWCESRSSFTGFQWLL